MLIVDFLAMSLLYFIHRSVDLKDEDRIGDNLMRILMISGGLLLFVDVLDKIKTLF